MVDAFDSDVLIYAATGDPQGSSVHALFRDATAPVGIGSLVLLPEILVKPLREGAPAEETELRRLLARLDLKPVEPAIADLAVRLGVRHNLRAADAIHLATAIAAGADRFITNNRRDFPKTIEEITIVYPEDLAGEATEATSDPQVIRNDDPPQTAQ